MTLEEDMMMRYRMQYKKGEAAGLERGEKLGLERGEKLGLERSKREIAKNFKTSGIPIKVISENTGLSTEEIEQL